MATKKSSRRRRAPRPVSLSRGWHLKVTTSAGAVPVLGDKTFVIKLSSAFHRKLRQVAVQRREYTTMQDLVAEALATWWETRRKRIADRKAGKVRGGVAEKRSVESSL